MSEKHYCLECQKLIEAGKEIKIEKENSKRYHYRSTWSRSNYIIFALLVLKSNKRKRKQKARKIGFISPALVEE